VKKLLHIFFSIYFAFIFTIGNAGIPYLAHTCKISNETQLFLFEWENNDACCGTNCSVPNESEQVSIKKMSCCEVEQGLLSADVDVLSVQSEDESQDLNALEVTSNYTSTLIFNEKVDATSLKSPPFILKGWTIRIQYQSFLC
jgi:hypothetical protein